MLIQRALTVIALAVFVNGAPMDKYEGDLIKSQDSDMEINKKYDFQIH